MPSAGPVRYTGVLVAASADSLVVELRPSGSTRATVRVPRAAVAGLEVGRGGAGRAVFPAAVLGAVVGWAAGAAVAAAVGFKDDPPCGFFTIACARMTGATKRQLVTAAGLLLGGGVGLLIGTGIDTERWEPVRPEQNTPRVGVVPLSGGRLGLGASLAF